MDTHALLWWVALPRRLSTSARRALEESEEIGVPAIVFWEIAVLARKGRVKLDGAVTSWSESVLAIPRLRCMPVTCRVAALADTLAMHQDPADRLIVATAIEAGLPLVTRDHELRKLGSLRTIW